MISQFETEVIRWKHANEKITKPVSLQEGFLLCDENYFPNINAVFKLILSFPVVRVNAVSALYADLKRGHDQP